MKKKLTFVKHLVALFLFSSACHAQPNFDKAGFGTILDEDNLIIYIPIQFKKLIIEPTIKWSSHETTELSYDGYYEKDETSTYEVGIGAFFKNEVHENTFINYGIRVGYSKGEDKSRYISPSFYSDYRKWETETYFISPTISFEYFLFPKISIGTNIGLLYTKTVRTYKDPNISSRYAYREDLRKSSTYTTEAIIRFYF
ncbi:MAG: hypothetical protein L3J98_17250 [Gammaproteobacteria bacterium]|nr:hypothetical protein [Gammaproteobacteria bacterium]